MTSTERQRLNPDPGGQFASDAHRRVAANLSIPRSLDNLRDALSADPNFPDLLPGELELIIRDLASDGHVKTLGVFDAADPLVNAVKSDGDVPTLPKAKARAFVSRTKRRGLRGKPQHVVAGQQLYFTNAGLDQLQLGLPQEPPALEDEALDAAKEQDEQLQADVEAKLAETDAQALSDAETVVEEIKRAIKRRDTGS